MKLWRISSYVDLSGEGGRYASGRWHLKGRRVLYAAETAALAMIEYLVNVGDRSRIPDNACLFSILIHPQRPEAKSTSPSCRKIGRIKN